MQYYFTAFIVIFFLVSYGYCYAVVQFAQKYGDLILLYGMLFGLVGFMAFCALLIPFLHSIFDVA